MTTSRRSFLQGAGALALGAVLARNAAAATPQTSIDRKRVLRAAHLTDVHISPGNHSEAGFRASIRHAQGQSDPAEFILIGGDCVGDSLGTPKDKVLAQWEVWDRVFNSEVKLPHATCLGNHDVLGWARRGDIAAAKDPDYGKVLGMRRLGLKDRYYSFDRAGWHFVILDSMMIDYGNGNGYTARLDDEQFVWLESDLAATPAATPVCVMSHIPIMSAAAFLDGDLAGSGSWVVPGAWMHVDARRIQHLFLKHPNVKACLSGHLHMVDDVTYLGVRYLCNGAVCGAWWNGSHYEFGPAYAMFDFFNDGTLERTMHAYEA
ncbi:MAG TPA: metallophosphoesterase [Candidatus Didemnitutus sp.]|nr:metallophosphoesterase [Candidatus Didemnitutus sp.]